MNDTAFDIISLNDNSVLVEGKLYKKNEVVKTIHTDLEGVASTSADLLRVAFMDVVIMQCALAEILSFPNIPVSVSLNEYVDIAKVYSTAP